MKQYLPMLLMCFWLSLAPAIGVSVPRHKRRIGRVLAAIFTSAAAGTILGFAAVLLAVAWAKNEGGNQAQAGAGYLLVMIAVCLGASYFVAKVFPVGLRA